MKSKILNFLGPLCLGSLPFLTIPLIINSNFHQMIVSNGYGYLLGYIMGAFCIPFVLSIIILMWLVSSFSNFFKNKKVTYK